MAYRQTAFLTCDRCHEEMPHREEWTKLSVYSTGVDGGARPPPGGLPPKPVDLCPGCVETLRAWCRAGRREQG